MNPTCPNCQHPFTPRSAEGVLLHCEFCDVVFTSKTNFTKLSSVVPLSNAPQRGFVRSGAKYCPLDSELLRFTPSPKHPFLTFLHCQKCDNYLLYPEEIAALQNETQQKFHQKHSFRLTIFALVAALSFASYTLLNTSTTTKASLICKNAQKFSSSTGLTYTCITDIPLSFEYAFVSCGGVLSPRVSESIATITHFFDLPTDTCQLLLSIPDSSEPVSKINLVQ